MENGQQNFRLLITSASLHLKPVYKHRSNIIDEALYPEVYHLGTCVTQVAAHAVEFHKC